MKQTHLFKILGFLIFLLLSVITQAQDYQLQEDNFLKIGRGNSKWSKNKVELKDAFIALKKESPQNFEMTFSVMGSSDEGQLQAWAGFGFSDRDNRYSLGLRGGNNNDLYLCRYQEKGKNKMLALESLDLKPLPGQWHELKLVFFDGNIRVYLNKENKPRIALKDTEYLEGGSAILGGGWLATSYKDFHIKELSNVEIETYLKDSIPYKTETSRRDKQNQRKKNRENYKVQEIKNLSEIRTEISLNGNWLFMPGYEMESKISMNETDFPDDNWHVMSVPDFWNPVRNWLHLEDAHLPHAGSGISDNYREKEFQRCENFTFDYSKTQSAWYRHWIILPEDIKGKHFNLHFDAVSKIAEVYVNGYQIGGHIGMFGEFDFNISTFVKPGKNLISVWVKSTGNEKLNAPKKKVAQAVSVDVTMDMLNSIPHGMFRGDEGGIWQGVSLIVNNPVFIDDVFAKVRMDGGDFEVSVKNTTSSLQNVEVKIEITDLESGAIFYSTEKPETALLRAQENKTLICKTGIINPLTWSPENPNLYKLKTLLYSDGKLIDQKEINIGFRTFEAIGNTFYLNGNPYWLRGANHPPCGIAPNDTDLANNFYKLMHDGNQMVTRSHGCPFTKTWMDASDKQGIGISYEGLWPWFMIGDIPSEELIEIWKKEMLALVKKYRNHPSLFIWTVNNEMYFTMFYHNDPPEIRLKKWEILSDLIKEIRELSPGLPISADSGYGRLLEDYEKNLKPNGIDDGDIDDRHVYFNWYNRDFFQVMNGEWAQRIYWSPGANSNRPFFSQETSTGYTNNDDGHFNRKYLFNNYVPQAWIGDWAYEDKNPDYTLKRHAFMSKELYELIRRTSPETAGVLLFANVCWYQNVFDAKKIKPWPIYESFKKAAQPVLVSAELFGRSYFADSTINPRICIVNNSVDGNEIPEAQLEWKIIFENKVLSFGVIKTDLVPYYDRLWLDSEIKLPRVLPQPKTPCILHVSLKSNDKILSENEYEILITEKNWLNVQDIPKDKVISVYDITGETKMVLDKLGINYQSLKDLTQMRTRKSDLIIIANLDADDEVPYSWEDTKKICGNGCNVLLIHPGKHLQWLYYDKIESIYERKGRVVNMHIPEHAAFNGIEPMELAWWQVEEGERPRACKRSYRLKTKENSKALATFIRPHTGLGNPREDYLKEMSGIPLLEIFEKEGRIISSEMECNQADQDPIAAKLLVNLILDLLGD